MIQQNDYDGDTKREINFCPKCGGKLPEGARVCPYCGFKISDQFSGYYDQREQKFAGTITKCPVCGEILPSMTGICPACGYEINAACVSESLQDFIDQLNKYDHEIDEDSRPSKTGWSTWGLLQRLLWIGINIVLLCIPLIVYLIIRWVRHFLPNPSDKEKQKADFIQNYIFTNDRETLLQALLFIKGKILYLSTINVDTRNDGYWSKVWLLKAKDIKENIKLRYKSDEVAEKTYSEMQKSRTTIRRQGFIRGFICVALLIAVIFLVTRCGSFIMSGGVDYNNKLVWPTSGAATILPEAEFEYGEVENESPWLVEISVYKVSREDYNDYTKLCQEYGFNVDTLKTSEIFWAYDSKRDYLSISYDERKQIMKISIAIYL